MRLSALRGVGVALVTPFDGNGEVDFPALDRLIGHVAEGGIDYLVPLGTTGETPVLSDAERKEVVRFTLEKAAGRIPVVVGVGGNNTREVIQQLETYPLEGALAILSVSPYYSKPSQEGLYQHYKAVAGASPRPVVLYNIPPRSGRNMTAATTLRLAREVENIVGIKEASGDLVQCMEIIRDRPEGFMVISGDDMLALSQIAAGMDGLISVAGNYMARDISTLVHAALDGRMEVAREAHYRMMEGFSLMFEENNPAGVKAFLAQAGICSNVLRLPVVAASETLQHKIADYFHRYAPAGRRPAASTA